jgi:pimeloyl-ACP methyl ester carboxylesterase
MTAGATHHAVGVEHRARLLAGIPVTERRIDAAGIPTAVLEGGDGPPVVVLHGPGESAVNWRWTIPDLVATHRVVAPDLPAHGSSGTGPASLDADRVVAWLGDVLDATCVEPPILVGHALGGAIAARFAARAAGHSLGRLRALVLVDALGLARFRPTPRFALGLVRFTSRPSERSFERFMRQCSHDADALRDRMGADWAPFVAYNVGSARSPAMKQASQVLRRAGLPRIPASELAGIDVPVTLIWGRHDRANRVRVAERAARRYGWALHVIDVAADDPARDQPEAFLRALRAALGS